MTVFSTPCCSERQVVQCTSHAWHRPQRTASTLKGIHSCHGRDTGVSRGLPAERGDQGREHPALPEGAGQGTVSQGLPG